MARDDPTHALALDELAATRRAAWAFDIGATCAAATRREAWAFDIGAACAAAAPTVSPNRWGAPACLAAL